MELRFEVRPETLRVARKFVEALALATGGFPNACDELGLATGEALANAWHHAYHEQPGPIELKVTAEKQILEVLIHDSGSAVTDRPPIPPFPPAKGEGKRGLFIMSKLLDELEIIPGSGGKGIAVRMVKDLARP